MKSLKKINFLKNIETNNKSHSGRTLIDHLIGVHDILKNNVKVWEYYKVTERQYYAGKRVPR